MKFGKIIQLWITVMMFFVSSLIYAADEELLIISDIRTDNDILTISPSVSSDPGIYEITISGIRDSDTATIGEYTTDIRMMHCNIGDLGCGQSVTVKAFIKRGQNSGKSTYYKKFKILLDEGIYYVDFLLLREGENAGDKRGKVIVPPNVYSNSYTNNYLIVSKQASVNITKGTPKK